MKYILLLFSWLLLTVTQVQAQENEVSTKGRDFWLTFMPNYHNNATTGEDSLYILIVAEEPCIGRIEYTRRNGQTRSVPFTISQAGNIHRFATVWDDAELVGINPSTSFTPFPNNNGDHERVTNLSFRITTDTDVSVYGVNQARLTSDAFIVYPVPALGVEYRVLAYNSDADVDFGGSLRESSTPSQFAIVATEDNTSVTINPSVRTIRNATRQQVITLNKGQTYLVQADMFDGGLTLDLSGSRIRSDKPIAVFGGQQRARVPSNASANSISRDCLISQIPPIQAWGKRYMLTPFAAPRTPDNSTELGNDVYRILASEPNTRVTRNGAAITLAAGQFIEANLTAPVVIEADKPVLCGLYKRSAGQFQDTRNGDPFFLVVPPVEQYTSSFRFINVDVNHRSTLGPAYNEHFITIVIESSAAGTVILDGAAVAANRFQRIATSEYSYANISVGGGMHTVLTDGDAAVYAYGYGAAVSYGYVAGGLVRKIIDRDPPIFAVSDSCGTLQGKITDIGEGENVGLSVVEISTTNANYNINFPAQSDTATFTAQLINPYVDGFVKVQTEDLTQNASTSTYQIPGFTVHPLDSERTNTPLATSHTVPIRLEQCFTVPLVNYGNFPQRISRAQFRNGKAVVLTPLPLTILPGERINLQYCFTTDILLANDTLLIGDSCLLRSVLALELTGIPDTLTPVIQADREDICGTTVVTIEERGIPFSGLTTINIPVQQQINCTVTEEERTELTARLRIQVLNPRADAQVVITVADGAGNSLTRTIEIPGYTLELTDQQSWKRELGEQRLGSVLCDTLKLRNYGKFPITIPITAMVQNEFFSVPPGQFPFVIPAGEERGLAFCYNPTTSVQHLDTFFLGNGCVFDTATVKGIGKPLTSLYDTRCNAVVKIEVAEATTVLSVSAPYPNPVTEVVTLKVETPSGKAAYLQVFDMRGSLVMSADIGTITQGISSVQIDVSLLPKGSYTTVLRLGEDVFTRTFIRSE